MPLLLLLRLDEGYRIREAREAELVCATSETDAAASWLASARLMMIE